MRTNGVRSLDVSCWQFHHRAILSADPWPDDVPVPTFSPRMVCTRCGSIGADARPNWKDWRGSSTPTSRPVPDRPSSLARRGAQGPQRVSGRHLLRPADKFRTMVPNADELSFLPADVHVNFVAVAAHPLSGMPQIQSLPMKRLLLIGGTRLRLGGVGPFGYYCFDLHLISLPFAQVCDMHTFRYLAIKEVDHLVFCFIAQSSG
jgi:hypothetical protein